MSDGPILKIDIWNPVFKECDCYICGAPTPMRWGVPVFNGDIVSNDFPDELWGESGGGQSVCESCYEKHARGEIKVFDSCYWTPPTLIDGAGI